MKGAVTFTVIFQASAVNRDEGIGGNIQSIKKLRRKDGIHSFLSRAFLRHKLFNALVKKYGWREAPLRMDKKVIQFDIENSSIIDSEELDFFGYMSTVSETAVRKAPVGMTKAVSLEPWEGDMAFYANHDLVRRALLQGYDATPDPFSKEEHLSLYKYSVSVDLKRIGKDEITLSDCKGRVFGIELGEGTVELDNGKITAEIKKSPDGGSQRCIVRVELNEDERKRRLKEFLDVALGGFSLHSSTEDWSTTPVFAIVAITSIPVVLFDPYVSVPPSSKLIERASNNPHVEKVWVYPGIFEFEGYLETVESTIELVDKVLEEIESNGKSEG